MKMFSAGAGLGIGVKDYRVIFVFENDEARTHFINSGWSGETQADAAAKTGTSGAAYSGAASVAPGVWVYQITKRVWRAPVDLTRHKILQKRRSQQDVAFRR
jgi:lipid-binding SYLF domain-containing protein